MDSIVKHHCITPTPDLKVTGISPCQRNVKDFRLTHSGHSEPRWSGMWCARHGCTLAAAEQLSLSESSVRTSARHGVLTGTLSRQWRHGTSFSREIKTRGHNAARLHECGLPSHSGSLEKLPTPRLLPLALHDSSERN
ncbi:hypothetical protein J6590_030221 [Homalodisca vitripennis]|nr:hypothetical protein J6590_030221 [Homalodisca vitripennis]